MNLMDKLARDVLDNDISTVSGIRPAGILYGVKFMDLSAVGLHINLTMKDVFVKDLSQENLAIMASYLNLVGCISSLISLINVLRSHIYGGGNNASSANG